MANKCPYPDKECLDRFWADNRTKPKCRLTEWVKKQGTCPYDASIKAVPRVVKKQLLTGQQRLL